jgi:DNA (cytosine-5)-methyltransferase 1
MLYKRGLDVVLADLAEMGYDAEWFTLSAQEIGALHIRERIFIIAYTGEFRQVYMQFQEKSSERRQQTRFKDSPCFITYNWQERIQRFKQEEVYRKQGLSWCKDVRRIEDLRNRQDIPKPLFCGSSDGIPYWMDRIGCCGNAVVPQVAQFIARRLKEIIEEKENYGVTRNRITAKVTKAL